jgi:hypothetical protein
MGFVLYAMWVVLVGAVGWYLLAWLIVSAPKWLPTVLKATTVLILASIILLGAYAAYESTRHNQIELRTLKVAPPLFTDPTSLRELWRHDWWFVNWPWAVYTGVTVGCLLIIVKIARRKIPRS